MPNTYFAGKQGSISFGGLVYPLDTWNFTSVVQNPEVSNFSIPFGQQAYIANLIGGEVSAEGPLTSAGTTDSALYLAGRPNPGNYVVMSLGVGPGLFYTVTCLVTEIETSQDVQSNARVRYTLVVTPNPNLV
jgi:hypothetical protein